MSKKILVLGKGYLGSEFERQGFETWGRDKFEVGQPMDFLEDYDVVVNCIGTSDTRWCEKPENFPEAMRINSYFVERLVSACRKNRTRLVHVSTGCLYDREGIACRENRPIAAHCSYTVTKWAGEMFCDRDRDIILRPRLLFGDVPHVKNLLCKMFGFYGYLDSLNSVTSTRTVVEATRHLIDGDAFGVFNVANEGAHTICDMYKMLTGKKFARPITTEQLRTYEGLHLVNNVMSIDLLKKYYQPPTVEEAVENARDSILSWYESGKYAGKEIAGEE